MTQVARFPTIPVDAETVNLEPTAEGVLIRCSLGDHYLPANERYFHRNRHVRRGWCTACKACNRQRRKTRTGRPQPVRRRIRPGYLSCSICDRDLPTDNFSVKGYSKDGKPYYDSYCKTCTNDLHRQTRRIMLKIDPEYDRRRRAQRPKKQDSRTVASQEYRAALRSRIIWLVDRLRKLGFTWSDLGRRAQVDPSTVKRWIDQTIVFLPDRPTSERAERAFQRALLERTNPGRARYLAQEEAAD